MLASAAGTAGATGPRTETGQPDRDGTIHQSLPISADSFQTERDCGPITEGTAWHFVLTNTTTSTTGSTLTATFRDAGTKTVGVHDITGGATHYFVQTGDGDLLTAASVSTGDGQLQLSHVCDAPDVDDDETSQPVTCPDGQMPADGDDADAVADHCVPEEDEDECPAGQMPGDGTDEDADDCVPVTQPRDVTICHATGSETNPYVLVTIAEEAVLDGHLDHQDGEDLIPAFGDFPGQPVGQGPIDSIDDCPTEDVDEDDETEVSFTSVDIECEGATPTAILFTLTGSDEGGDATVILSDDDSDEIDDATVTFVDGQGSGELAYPDDVDGTLLLTVTRGDATDVDDVGTPSCGVDDVPSVVFTSVAVECVGATPSRILFELQGDGDATTGTVSLTDADGADLGSTLVTFVAGEAEGSLSYPASFETPLLLSVSYDGATDVDDVPVRRCPQVGGDNETPDTPNNPNPNNPNPNNPEVPEPEGPEGPEETPGTDVEGEEVVNTPTPSVTPVVQPTRDRTPAVRGDVVTRRVAGQLPRTGADSTADLAPFGLALLLVGFALERSSRRLRQTV